MKTSYSIEYLEYRYGPAGAKKFMNRKRAEAEKEHGVKFEHYTAHGRFVLLPVLVAKDMQANDDSETVAKVVEVVKPRMFGRTFWDIHRETGLPLPEVMGVAKHLMQTQRAFGFVCRTGGVASIKLLGG